MQFWLTRPLAALSLERPVAAAAPKSKKRGRSSGGGGAGGAGGQREAAAPAALWRVSVPAAVRAGGAADTDALVECGVGCPPTARAAAAVAAAGGASLPLAEAYARFDAGAVPAPLAWAAHVHGCDDARRGPAVAATAPSVMRARGGGWPVVQSVDPPHGKPAVACAVVLRGERFKVALGVAAAVRAARRREEDDASVEVFVGGARCEGVKVVSDTLVTAVVPPDATGDVVIVRCATARVGSALGRRFYGYTFPVCRVSDSLEPTCVISQVFDGWLSSDAWRDVDAIARFGEASEFDIDEDEACDGCARDPCRGVSCRRCEPRTHAGVRHR